MHFENVFFQLEQTFPLLWFYTDVQVIFSAFHTQQFKLQHHSVGCFIWSMLTSIVMRLPCRSSWNPHRQQVVCTEQSLRNMHSTVVRQSAVLWLHNL